MRQPIAIDLCCGLGGWTRGLLAENWRVIGFDIVRPKPFRGQSTHGYPDEALFVLQDVSTLSGIRWRDTVSLIVASPPCTEFSYCRNFSKHRPPDPEHGMIIVRHCFRLARESGAPLVLENVSGARRWFEREFGPSTWHLGPYYFWGEPLLLRPQGNFQKGMWTKRTDVHRARMHVRNPAIRAIIPIEIARAVGAQFYPRADSV